MKDKWRLAIGTTSRVPDSGGLHYLIADFDDIAPELNFILSCADNAVLQRTEHGWHVYTDRTMLFQDLVNTLKEVKADGSWIKIGEKRGYFFLADKSQINFPWPVEHMVIYNGKEKTYNSKKTRSSV